MRCVCGDIDCIDTRFDNPEPIPPSVEEWEEIEKNNQLNEGNAPIMNEYDTTTEMNGVSYQ